MTHRHQVEPGPEWYHSRGRTWYVFCWSCWKALRVRDVRVARERL
jgi:hypothetical protein